MGVPYSLSGCAGWDRICVPRKNLWKGEINVGSRNVYLESAVVKQNVRWSFGRFLAVLRHHITVQAHHLHIMNAQAKTKVRSWFKRFGAWLT